MIISNITIESRKVLGHWGVWVRWTEREMDGTVRWRHLGPSYVQVGPEEIQELLESIAEEVYNWAPLAGKAGDLRSPASTLGGDSESSPPFDEG